MKKKVFNAISTATKNHFGDFSTKIWYSDSQINDRLNEAVANKWIFRPSVTQVQWTEEGIKEAVKSGHILPEYKEFKINRKGETANFGLHHRQHPTRQGAKNTAYYLDRKTRIVREPNKGYFRVYFL